MKLSIYHCFHQIFMKRLRGRGYSEIALCAKRETIIADRRKFLLFVLQFKFKYHNTLIKVKKATFRDPSPVYGDHRITLRITHLGIAQAKVGAAQFFHICRYYWNIIVPQKCGRLYNQDFSASTVFSSFFHFCA